MPTKGETAAPAELPVAPAATVLTRVVVELHKEGEDDEPLEIDIDVGVTCDCGSTASKRDQIYKERDDVYLGCDGCGAEYTVAVHSSISFVATATKTSGAVYPSADLKSRRGGHHGT